MKKTLLIIIALVVLIGLCACQGGVADITESTVTYEGTRLTAQELEWFNTEFFTSKPNDDGTTTFNIRNKFLLTYYKAAEQIDLWAVFYDGVSPDVQITQEEKTAFDKLTGHNEPLSKFKIPREDMERIFLEYTGITVEQSQKTGLEKLTYLEQWDAYYLQHSDTGYMRYEVFDGYTTEDGLVILHYKESPTRPARTGQVTLKPNGDSYWFVCNQPLE